LAATRIVVVKLLIWQPNGLFTGLAALQDSTVLKTRFFAPNRHFRGRFSQVRYNLGWRIPVFFLLWYARCRPSSDKGAYVGRAAIDSLWSGMGYLEALENTQGENLEVLWGTKLMKPFPTTL